MKINQLKTRSIFVDSCCFIYLLENNVLYADVLERLFSPEFDDTLLISSIITISEVITKPVKEGRNDLVDKYLKIFGQFPMKFETICRKTAIKGAVIRGDNGFNLIDSYQLAVSELCECEYFLTNDKQLQKYKGIKVILLSDLVK